MYTYKPKTKPALWESAFPSQARTVAREKARVRCRVRPVSRSRKAILEAYAIQRETFLAKVRWCPVAKACLGKRVRATEVHHVRGRTGKLLLDERHWLAVSRWGHEVIHRNPKFASKKGWLAGKGQWGRAV